MNPILRALCLLAFLIARVPLFAQTGERQLRTPFDEYPQVAPQVFAYERGLFTDYKGSSVARLNVPEYEERNRIGIVSVAPKVTAYVDRIDNLVHGPASLEITDVKSGVLLGKLDLGLISPSNHDAKLLFNGQGVVYLHHVPTSVCFGSATRKFLLNGNRLVETKQAIAYLGAEAEVFGDIKLFSSPDSSGSVVATLQDGAKVTVIGVAADSISLDTKSNQYLPTLLVKTPLGLTGWYLPGRSGQELTGITITQCN